MVHNILQQTVYKIHNCRIIDSANTVCRTEGPASFACRIIDSAICDCKTKGFAFVKRRTGDSVFYNCILQNEIKKKCI